MVIKIDWIIWVWLFSIRAWCDHVTLIPEESKIKVFSKGTWVALNGMIPEGGHKKPISSVGESLLWKKAQKNEKKNNTSEVINKIMPQRRPLMTCKVWRPWKVPSRVISRHHWKVVNVIIIIPRNIRFVILIINHLTIPVTIINVAKEAEIGHGLWSTKW